MIGRSPTSIALLLGSALQGLFVPSASATTHRVPSEYPTIQQGIDAAVSGDTVLVGTGTYKGDGNRDIDCGGKNLMVRSELGPEFTILDVEGPASPDSGHRGFIYQHGEGESAPAILDGFQIINGWMATSEFPRGDPFSGRSRQSRSLPTSRRSHNLSGAGIRVSLASPIIRNCIIRSCTSQFTGGGISLEITSRATVIGCTIVGCNAGLQGGGISIETASTPTIQDCVITGNVSLRGGGIDCTAQANLAGCIIAGNLASQGGGLNSGSPANPIVERCVIWGNCAPQGPGDEVYSDLDSGFTFNCCVLDSSGTAGGGQITYGKGNVFRDPLFCQPEGCLNAPTIAGEYTVNFDSPCLPEHNACGVLIGTLEAACGTPPAVVPMSWGRVKVSFR